MTKNTEVSDDLAVKFIILNTESNTIMGARGSAVG
jgi:hypothetical protein